MTNSEFSDTFTTLLNSYSTQAAFGEQASQREIVLDEYEKSVLLTQAQDIIVKSYFEGTTGQGFDDSIRRQVDFSSLIKVVDLSPTASSSDYKVFDNRGIVFDLPKDANTGVSEVLYILNEKLIEDKFDTSIWKPKGTYWYKKGQVTSTPYSGSGRWHLVKDNGTYVWTLEANGSTYTVTFDNGDLVRNEYVIVPINYKEYDREMSKPYAQPLKKQAWRLFQNLTTKFDVKSELIPKFNITVAADINDVNLNESILTFRLRYVKRPSPIILEDLPNNLVIDGKSEASECELNPILHMDILMKAVELALTTRGAAPAQQPRREQ